MKTLLPPIPIIEEDEATPMFILIKSTFGNRDHCSDSDMRLYFCAGHN
jgi:hypothetical protein